jgi:hypothetical protein
VLLDAFAHDVRIEHPLRPLPRRACRRPTGPDDAGGHADRRTGRSLRRMGT